MSSTATVLTDDTELIPQLYTRLVHLILGYSFQPCFSEKMFGHLSLYQSTYLYTLLEAHLVILDNLTSSTSTG